MTYSKKTIQNASYSFITEFYRFVRPKDKCAYDQLCKNITGLGCGYKPEDSVSKKRLHSDDPSTSIVNSEISFLPYWS